MEKLILKAIGNSLLESGNCPYDAACPFGRGSRCNASKGGLEERINAITDRINAPGRFAFQVTENASPWHCENIGIVQFVDPDED